MTDSQTPNTPQNEPQVPPAVQSAPPPPPPPQTPPLSPAPKKSSGTLIIILLLLFMAALGVGGYWGWVYYNNTKLANQIQDQWQKQAQQAQDQIQQITNSLPKMPPMPVIPETPTPPAMPGIPSTPSVPLVPGTPVPPPAPEANAITTPPTESTVAPAGFPTSAPAGLSETNPTAATPPASPQGTLDLKSTPPGASILIDQKDSGLKTPALLNASANTLHVITLKLEGYEPWERNLTLLPSSSLNIEAQLSKGNIGQASVISNPPGAAVYLDDQPTGLLTPAVLGQLSLNQPHRIRLVKEGYLPLEAVYTPINGDLQRLDLPLQPNPAVKKKKTTTGSTGGSSFPLKQTPPPPSPGMIIGY